MMRLSFSSLRARLLLLGFLAAIPAVELIVTAYVEQRRLVVARAKEDALKAAQFVARDYDDLIEGARQLLVALAQLPEVRANRATACSETFANLLTQYRRYSNFGALNANGDVVCSGVSLARPVNLADRAWFSQAMESRQFVVGEYVVGRTTGKPSLTFGFPILSAGGQARGAVFAGLDLNWLAEIGGKLQLPPGATLTLADRKGMILVQYPRVHGVGKPIPDIGLLGTILAKREGVTEAKGPDGRRLLIGFAFIGGGSEPDFYVAVGTSRDGIFTDINRAFRRNFLWLAIVILLVIVVTWVASDMFVLRRLDTVLGATRRLAAGDLKARTGLATRGQGELDQLAHAFDDMASSLEKADREKADFTAMIVHDLRSPLSTVTGAVSILDDGLSGPLNTEQKKWLARIGAASRRLVDLINDFLDLSKLEAGHIDLAKAETDLKQLIESSLDSYNILAQDKKVSLASEVAPDLPRLKADSRRLEQVFSNLLSNAIKFTGQGGKIEVGASRDSHAAVKIWVKDDGLGIPPREIGQLFQKYRQTTSGKGSHYKGTGLGLVICKMIVEAHEGKIWVESGEGRGATFFFTLPA